MVRYFRQIKFVVTLKHATLYNTTRLIGLKVSKHVFGPVLAGHPPYIMHCWSAQGEIHCREKQTFIISDGDDSGVPTNDHAPRSDSCDNEGKGLCVLHDHVIHNGAFQTSTCLASWDSQ